MVDQADLRLMNRVSGKGIELGPEIEAATLEMLRGAMAAGAGLQHYIG